MNHDDETPQGEMSDMAVSAAYRAAATLNSPAELDEKILRAATEDVKSNTKPAWTIGWLRPVTFLATAGLSIALLLEFSEMQVFGPPSGIDMNTFPLAPEFAADKDMSAQPAAAKADADRAGNVAEDNASGPAAASRPDPRSRGVDNDGANSFNQAANDAAKQIRAVDAAANATLSEMPESSLLSENAGTAPAATIPDAAPEPLSIEPLQCTDAQRASPDEWWLCIGDLQNAGQVTQAKTELQNFRETYPSFSP